MLQLVQQLILVVGGPTVWCMDQSVPHSAGDSELTISCKKDSAKQSLELAARSLHFIDSQ